MKAIGQRGEKQLKKKKKGQEVRISKEGEEDTVHEVWENFIAQRRSGKVSVEHRGSRAEFLPEGPAVYC